MGETPVISLDQRLEQILEGVAPLEALDVTLAEGRGCLVSDDVVATKPWPHYSSCTKAGFAARLADSTQGSLLSVVGEISATALKSSAEAAAGNTGTDTDTATDTGTGTATDTDTGTGTGTDGADPDEGADLSKPETESDTEPDAEGDKKKSRKSRRREKSRKTKEPRKTKESRKSRRARKSSATDTEKSGKSGAGSIAADVVGSLDPGQVAEVHVGAPLPAGADVVLPFDAVKIDEDSVEVLRAPESGQGVSAEGSIASEGTLLIPERTLIDARQVGVLSAIGLSRVPVVPRPRVVFVSVGDDLVSDSAQMGSKHKHDATSTLLASAAATAGAAPYRVAPIAEVSDRVAESLDDQLIRADVVVVCGPISSSSDTIREVVGRIADVSYDEGTTNLGAFGTGSLGDEGTCLISLPRDPVTAYLLFRVLVDPIIAGMLGFRVPEWESAELGVDVPLSSERSQLVLASVNDRGRVEPITNTAPTLVDLRNADAVIRLRPGSGTQRRGSRVPTLMLASKSKPA